MRLKKKNLKNYSVISSWKYETDRVENLAKPRHSVTPITTKRD